MEYKQIIGPSRNCFMLDYRIQTNDIQCKLNYLHNTCLTICTIILLSSMLFWRGKEQELHKYHGCWHKFERKKQRSISK